MNTPERQIKDTLNSVYELEGLLQMLLDRKHSAASLLPLITGKARKIADDTLLLAETEPEPEAEPEPIPEPEAPEVQAEEMQSEAIAQEAEETADTPSFQEIYDDMLADATMQEEEAEAEAQPEPEPEAAAEPEQPVYVTVAPSQKKPLRSLFSLNDVFRFRRELFGGNDADFKTTLATIDALPSFAEAEAYCYGEMMWNREDPEVQAFMEIIERHF